MKNGQIIKRILRIGEFIFYFSLTCWILYLTGDMDEYLKGGLWVLIPSFLIGFRFPSRVWRWGMILNLSPGIVTEIKFTFHKIDDPLSYVLWPYILPFIIPIGFIAMSPFTFTGVYLGYWVNILYTNTRIYQPSKST